MYICVCPLCGELQNMKSFGKIDPNDLRENYREDENRDPNTRNLKIIIQSRLFHFSYK